MLLKTLSATLTGLALSALVTSAATVPDPVNGDIYLAFRASGGDGSDSAYIVKLGQDTAFLGAAGGASITPSIGNIGADLAANYGAGWNTRADLFWGVFGVYDGPSPAVYGSKARSTPSTVTTAWASLNLSRRNSVATQVNSVLTGIDGYRGRNAAANSDVGTFQSNFSGAASYNYQVATAGTTDFGSLSQWTSIEGNFGGGVSATVLDLYRISGDSPAVRNVGRFSISAAGVVTFTATSTAPPANTDTDGDGQTDLQEVAAGTSPTNGSDFFRVQSVQPTANNITVRFNSAANRTYSIEYSESLATGTWQIVGTHTSGASGTLVEFLDTDTVRRSKPKGFYRVQVTQ